MDEPSLETIDFESLDNRCAEIIRLRKSRLSTEIFSGFSLTKPLDIIKIGTNFLIYRLDNGRTRSQQAAWASKHSVDRNWFTENPEEQTRQQQQHNFLWELAQRSAGSEGISIVQALSNTNVQTQSLLITSDGVVVDGNRRLTAMRELHHSDPKRFSDFAYATCAVLPPEVNELDIRLLEIAVQMAPETKLKYSWVNDALTYRSFIEDGFTVDQIAERAGSGIKRGVVKQRLDSLTEADLYLSNYLGAPLDYELVEKAGTAFKNLAAATNSHGDGLLTDKTRAVSHVLISQASSLGDRVYSYIQPLKDAKNVDRIYEILEERGEFVHESQTSDKESDPELTDDDDLFEDLDDDDTAVDNELADIVGDPGNKDEIADAVHEAAEAMLNERKQGKLEEKPLKIIKTAIGGLKPFSGDDVFPEYAEAIKSQALVLKEKLDALIDGAEAHLDSED